MVVAKSVFRSVDVEYQRNIQRLSQRNELFKEEVTLAHRQHIEDHIKEQSISNLVVDRIAAQQDQEWMRNYQGDAQQGPPVLNEISSFGSRIC